MEQRWEGTGGDEAENPGDVPGDTAGSQGEDSQTQPLWVPDALLSASSSEYPDGVTALVVAEVGVEAETEAEAAGSGVAAAAAASTMTVAMPLARTSIPEANGAMRSSSARAHQHRHHHHHHHHHRRRHLSRDGKEAPRAEADCAERRGLRAMLRAVAAACSGRRLRYK